MINTLSASALKYGSKVAVTLKGGQTTCRQAIHLIFLIDVSGSMDDRIRNSTMPVLSSNSGELKAKTDGSRLNSVKRSLEFLIPLLTPTDIVTLITFGDESEVLDKVVQMDEQGKSKLLQIIRGLKTNGCTNMSSAILQVADLFKDDPNFWASPGHKHGVLLLTDGHANRGVFTPDGLMSIIAKLITDNPKLSLATIGYGQDHNSELLKQAATTGSGSYNVVNTLEDIATTFGEVLGGLTTVVAQNMCITFPPGVQPLTAFNTSSDNDGVVVRVGDIYAEQEVIVLADNYTEGAIGVTGYDMSDLSRIHMSISVEPVNTPPRAVVMAEFRYRVSQLLLSPNKENAETLLKELQDISDRDNLVEMMIEDCETVLETLHTGGSKQAEVEMAQHSAYLSLGRGLRCAPTSAVARPPSPPHSGRSLLGRASGFLFGAPAPTSVEPGDPTPLTRRRTARVNYASSPFSNQTQQATTTIMRERTSMLPPRSPTPPAEQVD